MSLVTLEGRRESKSHTGFYRLLTGNDPWHVFYFTDQSKSHMCVQLRGEIHFSRVSARRRIGSVSEELWEYQLHAEDERGYVEQWTAQGHCRCGPRLGSSLSGQLSGLGKTLCLQNEMNYYDITRRLWGLHVQVNIDIFSYYLSLLTAFYWVGRKVSSNFSKRCYGKTQMNFLVNLIYIYICNSTWSLLYILLLSPKK